MHDIGPGAQHNVMNSSFWSRNFGSPFMGTCHTFNYPVKVIRWLSGCAIMSMLQLNADMIVDGVVFMLDPELSYRVLFHDPRYFLMASNPLVFPRIWKEYKAIQYLLPNLLWQCPLFPSQANSTNKAGNFEWLYISVTEHQLLNREEQPCQPRSAPEAIQFF